MSFMPALRVLAVLLASLSATAQAGTVYVCTTGNDASDGLSWATAKKTVQAGLNAAVAGDQVWVAAGTYDENITLALGVELYGGFAADETTLSERDWLAHRTILDGGQSGSVVTAPSGATASTRIDGFTITNGQDWSGGGLYLNSSSPTIANNTITGNSTSENGGGLCLINSSPTIANNTIAGNRVGVHGEGGGLYLYGSSPVIINNTIMGNQATAGGWGGGLYLATSFPTITNNTITGNSASYEGGGLYLVNSSSPTITNTIIAFNSSGIYQSWTSETPALRHNCVYGNGFSDYSGLADPTGSDGNMKADPNLGDAAHRNFHLQPNSPCVNAGDDHEVQNGWLDMDGQPRQIGMHVDIGADESDGTVWTSGPNVIVRVSPAGDDANDGSSWALAKRTVQAGIDAATTLGGEVWVAAGRYAEQVTLRPYAYLFGGFAGDETQRNQRNWVANVTILDGSQDGSVVTARNIAPGLSTIDGFTITNGSHWSGGGLYLNSSSPTIANNTITGNSTSGDGGGLYLYRSSPVIANNTIRDNIAARSGGGLHLELSSPTITNNTITGNSTSRDGGGLCLVDSFPTITNTIIAFNSSGICQSGTGGTPALRHNCVYGNGTSDYSGLADPTGSDGNIRTDPKMADPSHRNLHIQPDSPCRDAGDDAVVQAEWMDFDGQGRIQGNSVDIGADESDGTAWPAGPYVIVRVSPQGDDAHDGSTWNLAKRTVQGGVDAAATLGGEVWVAAGRYAEQVTLRPYAYLFGGFAGDETQRNQRNWVANVTILDGSQDGSVVTASNIAPGLSTIDGFTITNGLSTLGGGLCLDYASPTIANNTITGNNATVEYGRGGGLHLSHSSPRIANNTITDNNASSFGGGLYLDSNFSLTIANNTIAGNSASFYGGGLYLYSSSPTVVNNTITGNSASSGGGLYLYSYSSPMIANNTITGNSASSSGGGLRLDSYCSPVITNVIIAFNSSGIYRYPTNGTPTLRDNCVHGNTASNYSGLTNPTGTNGNISVDPLLVRLPSSGADGTWGTADDDYGDLHLLAGSPCINAGDPAYVPASGETDLDGQARKIGSRVDIGADEFCLAGDANFDGYVNVGDLQVLVMAWGMQRGEANYHSGADSNGDGHVNVGDLQLLVANWGKS